MTNNSSAFQKQISIEGGMYGFPRKSTNIIGTILREVNWNSLLPYTITGTGISVSANQLNMTGGDSSFGNYISLTDSMNAYRVTSMEEWKISIRAIAPTLNSTSYGFGVGIRCANSFTQMSALFRWAWDTGSGNGIFMYPNNSLTSQLTSGGFTSPGSGNTVWFDVVRSKNIYTCTAYQADHSTVLINATFTMNLSTGATNQANNTGVPILSNFGGTNIKILEWNITSPAAIDVDYAFIGDSNQYGMFAVSNSSRWAENAMTARNKTFRIFAGIGDRTVDAVTRLNEVIACRPKRCCVCLGRNDIAGGIATATWQANFNTIFNTLINNNIEPIILGPIASNVDVSAQAAWLKSFPFLYVDFYGISHAAGGTGLLTAWNSGDNIHINSLGNAALSEYLQNFIR